MINRKLFFLILLIPFFVACDSGQDSIIESEVLVEDNKVWRALIELNDSTDLPFNFQWSKDSILTIFNAEERIVSNSKVVQEDSILIGFPIFANYFIFKLDSNSLNGFFIDPDRKNGRLKLVGFKDQKSRFIGEEEACCDINKKWAVRFSPNSPDEYPAIAYFVQDGNMLSGTFLTETGDYRYLQGNIFGNTLKMSTFDGAHLFLFTGELVDQEIRGQFYSGKHWNEPWIAQRNDDFQLRHSDSLTFLKEGYDSLTFSFPDSKGLRVGIDDEEYKGKALIVQLMGTWCPNCMDESRYLKSIYEEYHKQGLEVISLAFERREDEEIAFKRIEKLKSDLELPYPILLAGPANKKAAAKALPMLNHIMSFPTAIYLNKNHEIVKIHTGFSGPGTPVYAEYVKENKIFIEELLK